jgi:sensor histidine kinase YesM
MSTAMLRDMTLMQAIQLYDGANPVRGIKLWGSSMVEDAAQYLVLQGILTGAAFYVRLKAEQALRERLASEYDRARLQALRMQTNPHFLFNTLSAIAGLIRTRPEGAESMVTQLGELFRATLVDRDADLVPLRRELDLGAQYLEIQRARFDSRFDYRIHAPEEVSDALVPPLLLQPLLENAAEYGLTGREGTIEVDVCCSRHGDRVRVTVTNHAKTPADGPGAARHGFGLENVRERLRAAFGATATFSAEHTNAGSFEARLEFPTRREVPTRHAKEASA